MRWIQIRILTSSFSAEYGRAGGAVLNTTLKSGTNQLRGTFWEFHRNDALNSNDFFANRARPQERGIPLQSVRRHGRRTRWLAGRPSGLPTTKAA